MNFSKIALDILEKRYLVKNEDGTLSEDPEGMFRRVAKAVASVELSYTEDLELVAELEESFFDIMQKGLFMPNTPTLMNAGRPLGQLSACFVLPIEDSMESIFDGVKNAALIHKSGGGTGFAFNKIRPKGDYVSSTGGTASGPISFMKIYNAATGEVKQGRARRGANMGILNDSHPDIEEFITCKTIEGEMTNFNISVGISNKFIQAVRDNAEYALINPRTGKVVRMVKAAELFDKICKQAWLNGEPGVIFFDKINEKNPLPETIIDATNPCITGDSLIQVRNDDWSITNTPIKTLVGKNNFHVLAYSIEKERIMIGKVLNVWKSGRKPVYKITYKWKEKSKLKIGSIKATADHKIMMNGGRGFKKGQYVACENLVPGDLIMSFPLKNVKEITSIKYVGEEDVFDMTVEKYHNFAVNGIFVKNCGEQPLLPYESCNLGSINLAKMVFAGKDGKPQVNYGLISFVVKIAVRFLDNIIDANSYPLQQIKEMTLRSRKIGLGIMGLADMLLQLGIPYDSKEGLETAALVMQKISLVARATSYELGKEKGSFPDFSKSKYVKNYSAMRNATATTIAPTGTISLIVSASASGEPIPFLVYQTKVIGSGGVDFDIINSIFETHLKNKVKDNQTEFDRIINLVVENGGSIRGLKEFSKEEQELFVTASDISPEYHVRMQAVLQSFTDNAVSKTLNLPNSTTVEEIKQIYLQAYDLGCKGVTAYRIGSRQEEVMSVKDKPRGAEKIISRKRPLITYGPTYKINTGCGNLYATLNSDEHGLCEVFIRVGKSGGCALAQSEAITRGVSRQLRAGIDVREIIKDLSGIRCPNPAWNNERMILSCPDAIAFVLEKHINGGGHDAEIELVETEVIENSQNKRYENIAGVCECGGLILREGRCATCQFCGFSKC